MRRIRESLHHGLAVITSLLLIGVSAVNANEPNGYERWFDDVVGQLAGHTQKERCIALYWAYLEMAVNGQNLTVNSARDAIWALKVMSTEQSLLAAISTDVGCAEAAGLLDESADVHASAVRGEIRGVEGKAAMSTAHRNILTAAAATGAGIQPTQEARIRPVRDEVIKFVAETARLMVTLEGREE